MKKKDKLLFTFNYLFILASFMMLIYITTLIKYHIKIEFPDERLGRLNRALSGMFTFPIYLLASIQLFYMIILPEYIKDVNKGRMIRVSLAVMAERLISLLFASYILYATIKVTDRISSLWFIINFLSVFLSIAFCLRSIYVAKMKNLARESSPNSEEMQTAVAADAEENRKLPYLKTNERLKIFKSMSFLAVVLNFCLIMIACCILSFYPIDVYLRIDIPESVRQQNLIVFIQLILATVVIGLIAVSLSRIKKRRGIIIYPAILIFTGVNAYTLTLLTGMNYVSIIYITVMCLVLIFGFGTVIQRKRRVKTNDNNEAA